MARFERKEILARLAEVSRSQGTIIATSAGIGIAAKCQAYAGCDLILVDNAARLRMAGYGSLGANFAYKNSTDMLYHQAEDILPLVPNTPVLAGITAAEPFHDLATVIRDMLQRGFSGICNSPTMGWNDPMNMKNLNKLGIGYATEVEMIRSAHAQDIFTMALCFDEEEATDMASAGADIVVAEIGLTAGGMIGAGTALAFEDAKARIQSIADAAHAVNPDAIALCHGGILSTPEAVDKMLNALSGVAGFLGGSATDRLPMECGIVSTAKGFKNTRLYGFSGK